MQDFFTGIPITQADYKIISIHLDNADILEKEWMDKKLLHHKPKLSRYVDFS